MNIIRHIPNTITSMNLLCGVLGVIFSFEGRFDIAFYLMLAAAVCDFFDGFAARLLKAYSAIGKELDSLADMVSFGVLPSLMLHRYMVAIGIDGIIIYIPLVISVFSALRLAKFNVDDRQTENFIGLATPACAMWCGSLIYFSYMGFAVPFLPVENCWFFPAAAVILSLLLVSEIPMFSMKFKKDAEPQTKMSRIAFLAVAAAAFAVTVLMKQHFAHAILFIFLAYILMNVAHALMTCKK